MNQEQARHNMVEQQIRPWNVLDQATLDLIATVAREDFVDSEYTDLAFADTELPIGHDEIMMSPKLEARLLQLLQVRQTDDILEIGTGSGYLTALLASAGQSVLSIDRIEEFSQQASRRLSQHDITNADCQTADIYNDWSCDRSFDVIVLTGSLPVFDERFRNMLETNGRLFVITGNSPVMEARLITRLEENEWSDEAVFETELPALIGARTTNDFTF